MLDVVLSKKLLFESFLSLEKDALTQETAPGFSRERGDIAAWGGGRGHFLKKTGGETPQQLRWQQRGSGIESSSLLAREKKKTLFLSFRVLHPCHFTIINITFSTASVFLSRNDSVV